MKEVIFFALLNLFVTTLFSQANTNQWTWIRGDSSVIQYPKYGTLGVSAADNKPGARQYASTWSDSLGNLWLFGGEGFANDGGTGALNDLWKYNIVNHQWVWISGNNIRNQFGSYGILGTESGSNRPGARSGALSWIDKAGKLWLFGGNGLTEHSSGYLNDLWKFDPLTNRWTWMNGDSTINQPGIYGSQGVAAAENKPGGRLNAVRWMDAAGNFWLFGGSSNAAAGNDLWKYDPVVGQWTWVNGANTISTSHPAVYGSKGFGSTNNTPGSRFSSASATDAFGDLWLFAGFAGDYQTDLWKYTISTGEWTWVSGDINKNLPGVYGTSNVPALLNKPGSRKNANLWGDKQGNIWLFGGSGFGATDFGTLNDLWKFSSAINEWTWVGGDNNPSKAGHYGSKGVGDSANKPGTRQAAVNWTDTAGNFWVMGGSSYVSNNDATLNDLWNFSVSSNTWTWVSGDDINNQTGEYGTIGAASSINTPGTRDHMVCWSDQSGSFWLFGGNGATSNAVGSLNDLWKYSPAADKWSWIGGSSSTGSYGVYGQRGLPSINNVPGGRSGATGAPDANGDLWLFGGTGMSANFSGALNDLWKYSLSTGQWTWFSGDTTNFNYGVYGAKGTFAVGNKPGSRYYGISWTTASGDFYLFGGVGLSARGSGSLNDLWQFSAATGQWTWLSGDTATNQYAVYGTQGVASPANKPGARYNAISWSDAAGNLWLFGGVGLSDGGFLNSDITTGYLSDLWMYNLSLGQWTWVGGNRLTNKQGLYGNKGEPAVNNGPGGRSAALSWKDGAGSLWLYGGTGYSATGLGNLNDLWRYQPANNTWTWMNGDNFIASPGVYGTRGVSDAHNNPGSRVSPGGWVDISGNRLWLFGGGAYPLYNFGPANDLWQFLVPQIALPVKLINLTAQKYQQDVLLNWNITTDQNTVMFVVEHSLNGLSFDSIGMVANARNAVGPTNYSFLDKFPASNSNFYRVKQLDIDGRGFYSAIIKLSMDEVIHFVILQNPVHNTIIASVQLPVSKPLTFQVRDINGRFLKSKKLIGNHGSWTYAISVNDLPSGSYLLNLQTTNYNITKPFIKEP